MTIKWEKIISNPEKRTIEHMNNSIIIHWITDYATSLKREKKDKNTIKQYIRIVYDNLLPYQYKINKEDDIDQIKVDVLRQRENTKTRKEFVEINRMIHFLQFILQKQGKPAILKKKRKTVSQRAIKKRTNSKIVNQFYKERNIQDSTISGYESAFRHYLLSQNTNSIDKLLKEALKEQKEKVPLPETKLKQRLISFRQYMIDDETLSTNTIKSHFCKVKSFYRHMEVMIPHIKEAKLEKPYVSNYEDLPTKEELIQAVEMADPLMKAFMVFQISSGQARAEACSITIGQFVEACEDYCDRNLSIQDKVEQLSHRDDVVPVFYLRRLKTDKWYYTCCSPEAVYYICKYLNQKTIYGADDPLFDLSASAIIVKYNNLNDKLRLGRVGYYRKLRSHVMRKYHATKLPLSPEEIDMLQGRSRSDVHEAYIKINPKRIKQLYMGVMEHVLLQPEKWMKKEKYVDKEVNLQDESMCISQDNLIQQVVPQQQIIPQQVFDGNVYKEIGKLELRIEQLEKRIKTIEGGTT